MNYFGLETISCFQPRDFRFREIQIMMWIFLIIASSVALGHEIDPSISEVTVDNFESKIGVKRPWQNNTDALTKDWFLMFYSPTCPHCQHAMPFWNQFGKMAADSENLSWVTVGAVNCMKNMALCNEMKATSFPTFLYLTKDHNKLKYTGSRNKDEFYKFAVESHTGKKNEKQVSKNETKTTQKIKSEVKQKTKSSTEKNADNTKNKTQQKMSTSVMLHKDSDRSSNESSNSNQKHSIVIVKKSDGVSQKISNFFKHLTAFQILQLFIIIGISLGLIYLLILEDPQDFKRIGTSYTGQEHGMLGLPEEA